MNKLHTVICLLLLHVCAYANNNTRNYIFKNGTDGYKMYRIPVVVKAANGNLLAFCEGRQSLFDHGNIDIVMKSSADDGKTWSELKVVWNDDNNTCGNPAPVLDAKSGDILLTACLNNDKVYVMRSADDGTTWSVAKDITASIKPVDWKWYATGPVHGIQMKYSSYNGRMIIPCNHTTIAVKEHISHIIFSDDGGYNWQLGGSVPCTKTDECTMAELSNGLLLLNMRNAAREYASRKISYSKDGGINWQMCKNDTALIEPVCQGSLLRYNDTTLLFCNPADKHKRRKLTLRLSNDGGYTWVKHIQIHKGPSAYSDMVILNNGDMLSTYETGKIWPYGGVAIATIKKDILLH